METPSAHWLVLLTYSALSLCPPLSAADKTDGKANPAATPQWSPPKQSRPASVVTAEARKEASRFNRLLNNPKPLTKDAVEVFAEARALYREGLFQECQEVLQRFWTKNKRKSLAWPQQQENVGYKLGMPCGYPGLVILTRAVAWRVAESKLEKPVKPFDWNVVALLVGKSSGNMPSNDEQAKTGEGTPVSATIDEQLLASDNALLHDSIWLTGEYYRAMTEGKINLNFRVVHLPDVEFKVCTENAPDERGQNLAKLRAAMPPDVASQADWFWMIYPCIEGPRKGGGLYHLANYGGPDSTPGGMTQMPGTEKPLVMCEDHWLTRRPVEDGRGPNETLSRQIYIPYWLQHEFFHNHFGQNKHLQLEATSHQWFDRSTWPSDFVGRFEADYYDEAVTKRLMQQAKPSWAGYFIHRSVPPPEPLDKKLLEGRYSVENPANGWGSGEIEVRGSRITWKNNAGKSWGLEMKPGGLLETDKNAPYHDERPHFEIMAERGPDGLPGTGVGGFQFGDQLYKRIP